MGMDIYAGTFTRYYCRNWKTMTQQICEQNGWNFQRITPYEDNSNELDPVEVAGDVLQWTNCIVKAMTEEGLGDNLRPWTENNDIPYYTDKPDWLAYEALNLYAAAKQYGEEFPKTVLKGQDLSNHPLTQRMSDDKNNFWSMVAGVEIWLPLDTMAAFNCVMPNDTEKFVSTVSVLKHELETINENGWNADEETISGWSYTEGYPVDVEVPKTGKISSEINEHTEYDTESLAKFAYSILWQAVRFSEKENVPIILDY